MRPMLRISLIILTAFAITACDDGDSDDTMTPEPEPQPEAQPEGEPEPAPSDDTFAFTVTGTLFTDDLSEAQAYHDQLAAGGQEAVTAAGDFGHEAMLGTDLLGGPVDQFFAMDRWTNTEGMAVYEDPEFAAAFGMLFDGPPSPNVWVHRPDWYGWGDVDIADDEDEYFWVVVMGELADDPENIQMMHDQVAAGGEESVTAAGDVAHVVYLGLENPRAFMAIDIWTDSANIEAVYTNPDFQAAFGGLFTAPPSLTVYRSTDWHQW